MFMHPNKRLKNVDVSKACGCDGISNKVLKFCANGLLNLSQALLIYHCYMGVFPINGSLQMSFRYLRKMIVNRN